MLLANTVRVLLYVYFVPNKFPTTVSNYCTAATSPVPGI